MAARALVASWDNSTRGLDSSTALAYIAALRLATTHLHRTSMVCLYQASDAMYDMFDKVCLLYEGHNEPPNTSEEGEPKASDIKDNERSPNQCVPLSLTPTMLSKASLCPYVISIPMQIAAVMARRMRIVKGDWFTQVLTSVYHQHSVPQDPERYWRVFLKRGYNVLAVAGIVLLALGLYTGYHDWSPSLDFIYQPYTVLFRSCDGQRVSLNGRCSTLVPSGPVGYENVALANQVCTTVGSMPGQDNIDGNRFLDLSFGYRYSHLWRVSSRDAGDVRAGGPDASKPTETFDDGRTDRIDGSFRTTLLNVLAERVDTRVVSGDQFVNGQRLPRDFQAQTGILPADGDTHVPTQTVREALRLARLRQPREVLEKEKDEYAEKYFLKMCGLEAFVDAMPQLLLFLDEPTSGLGSQSAWAIVQFLRELADNGQAILCTIHQPSAELFQIFDRILLLRKGGETVYFGDLGPNSTTLINHFGANVARQCKPDENPAEYMLEAIGAGATAPNTRDWHDIWLKSGGSQRLTESLNGIHSDGRRNPPVELILNIFGGIFIGFTFFKANNTIQGTQNKVFAIFISTILSSPACQSNARPLHQYALALLFPMYYTTVALAVASMAPSAEIAGLLFNFLFSILVRFDLVLMVWFSHFRSLAGGDGCIGCRPTP
ncbi:hypothetical protein HGRIS_006548 [Hohenbuehelia grisea]|uniref:ABC transporter domain-containing protein n=1 Tax=Hohenbuehelia grisea TaxID=104357 RepID=A0ABR3J9U9_9AGAR